MSYEPNLRLRRKQPRLIGNILSIAICVTWAVTFLAWGLMPGPAPEPDAPGVDSVKTVRPCDPTTVLPDNC